MRFNFVYFFFINLMLTVSYSYSVSQSKSGVSHDSTAYIGCNDGVVRNLYCNSLYFSQKTCSNYISIAGPRHFIIHALRAFDDKRDKYAIT